MVVFPDRPFLYENKDPTLIDDRNRLCRLDSIGSLLSTTDRSFYISSLIIFSFSWFYGDVPSRYVRLVIIFWLKVSGSVFLGDNITFYDEKLGLTNWLDNLEVCISKLSLTLPKFWHKIITLLCVSSFITNLFPISLKSNPIEISYILCYRVANVSKWLDNKA